MVLSEIFLILTFAIHILVPDLRKLIFGKYIYLLVDTPLEAFVGGWGWLGDHSTLRFQYYF